MWYSVKCTGELLQNGKYPYSRTERGPNSFRLVAKQLFANIVFHLKMRRTCIIVVPCPIFIEDAPKLEYFDIRVCHFGRVLTFVDSYWNAKESTQSVVFLVCIMHCAILFILKWIILADASALIKVVSQVIGYVLCFCFHSRLLNCLNHCLLTYLPSLPTYSGDISIGKVR